MGNVTFLFLGTDYIFPPILVKDNIQSVNRNLELMATRRQLEEEVGMLRR